MPRTPRAPKAPDAREEDLVCVGRLAGPHGLRGEVRLKSFTEVPEDIASYGPLRLGRTGRTLTIAGLRPAGDGFVARLEGVGDRTAAEALGKGDLYVPRAVLPETEDADTFYHADLIGLAAVLETGEQVGSIRAVHDFGAGDMLELFVPGRRTTLMVPFTREAVPEVRIAEGRVVLAAVGELAPGAGEGTEEGPEDGQEEERGETPR